MPMSFRGRDGTAHRRDPVIGRRPPARGAPRELTAGEERAERLACALDRPVTVAGIVFILVVLADTATPPDTDLATAWTIITWVLWALFVVEFVARLVMARSTVGFLRRNWWQILFLLVPFLRFLRSFSRSARLARAGSSSVRSARTAAGRLGSRLAWLAALTVSVVLLGTNLLYELDVVASMPDALHSAALATIAGEPIPDAQGWGRAVEIVLIMWSAVGFAALAGAAGAFFLE
jgi:voltage-gated potassium channel